MAAIDFYNLRLKEKQEVLDALSRRARLPAFAVEKDWWVVQTLRLIFQMDVARHLVFKGGTSLSKAWGLIERLSEDIDLAINREFLDFDGQLSRTQVGKLRDASHAYITEYFCPALSEAFMDAQFDAVSVQLGEIATPDQDPIAIEIHYPPVADHSAYIEAKVLVEIGGRSMREPFSNRSVTSLVSEHYPDQSFADEPIDIPSVNPERTYLEKLFLLHEEHQRPEYKRRVHRLSRHLYDIERISTTDYAQIAKSDHDLYNAIVAHRELFTRMSGVDYTTHFPPNLNPLPPADVLKDWERDYTTMQEEMIHGESLPFDDLISRIQKVVDDINQQKIASHAK